MISKIVIKITLHRILWIGRLVAFMRPTFGECVLASIVVIPGAPHHVPHKTIVYNMACRPVDNQSCGEIFIPKAIDHPTHFVWPYISHEYHVVVVEYAVTV